jgi:transposase
MSIPGVAVISAFTFLAYIGVSNRFSSAKKPSSYAGLVPRMDISGDQIRYGRIKPGCIPIKSIILQTSWGLIRLNMQGPLKEFYQRLYQKIGKKKAAVATVRKLLETFYTMLKNKETYWPADAIYVQRKLKQYALI